MGGKPRGRAVAGVAGLALAGGYLAETLRTLSFGSLDQPGAAVFPLVVTTLMAQASLALVVEQVRRPEAGAAAALDLPRGPALARVLFALGGLVAYVVLAVLVGHLPASIVLCVVMVRVLERGSWTRTLVTAALLAAGIDLLFVRLLGVPLPAGRLLG